MGETRFSITPEEALQRINATPGLTDQQKQSAFNELRSLGYLKAPTNQTVTQQPQAAPAQTAEPQGLGGQIRSGIKGAIQQLPEAALLTGGELVGGALGATLGGPPGLVGGAVLGGTVMHIANELLKGRGFPNQEEIAIEAGLSLLPEAGEQLVKGGVKQILKASNRAKVVRQNLLANEAEKLGEQGLVTASKGQAKQYLELSRRMNVEIPAGAFRESLEFFDDDSFKILNRELRRAGSPFDPNVQTGFGRKIGNEFEALRKGATLRPNLSLNELQDIRSRLTRRLREFPQGPSTDQTVADVLGDGIAMIDKAIDQTFEQALKNPARQTDATAIRLLQQGRDLYRQAQVSEDFTTLMYKRNITKSTADARLKTFELGAFADAIRKPQGKFEEQLAQRLNSIPEAKEKVLEFLDRAIKITPRVEFEATSAQQIPIVGQAISAFGEQLARRTGRQTLERIITQTKGRINLPIAALLINGARRSEIGVGTQQPERLREFSTPR